MANPPPDNAISTVMDFTGFGDRNMITSALEAKNNNIEAVVGEFFDSPEKFKAKYGWDEGVFASNREGDEPSTTQAGTPSFVIHPADGNQVIYGTDPGFYGSAAPSRPPSRANNRSPLSRAVDIAAGGFSGSAPNNQHEEEALLQRAISESLNTSGVPSPQTLPPPPPLPQQSGVMSGGEGSVHFGPANRSDYNPDEWAMVSVKRRESDPEAPRRQRLSDAPVFLRCRNEDGWKQHRLGGVLTILHSIPAARNALLHAGNQPQYGYGENAAWWKGDIILPPELQAAKEAEQADSWASEIYPPWPDELHRVIAFLDSTWRSYGTADILAESRATMVNSGDRERDFFEELENDPSQAGTLFQTSVEIVSLSGDPSATTTPSFTLLDNQFQKESLALAENLYSVWDMIFYTDAGEDLDNARMAMITKPGEVLTFRFSGEDGWPNAIDIPETFYIDRYLAEHQEEMRQLQVEMSAINAAFRKSREWEQRETIWVDPETGKTWDARVIHKAGISRCQELITKIKNRASWRDHQAAASHGQQTRFYLPPHEGEPNLSAEEAEVVTYYEAKIRDLEAKQAKIEQTMNEQIVPLRQQLEKLSRYLSSLLTQPSEEKRWNPTHKYTLRGVVADINKVFVRKRETSLMELDADTAPGEQWWKLSCESADDHAVLAGTVDYECVTREACGIGCKPILVYATDNAMEEAPTDLSTALKTFVKFDNRHFGREIDIAENENAQQNMSYTSTLRAAGFPVKKQRSDSMDSMATNKVSMGGSDNEMQEDLFGREEDILDGGMGSGRAVVHESTPDLVDFSADQEAQLKVSTGMRESPPAQEMQEMQEMQERAYTPLLTRPASGIIFGDRDGTKIDEAKATGD